MPTVREIIKEMSEETFDNEKDYQLDVVDQDGVKYKIRRYDWCDTTLIIEKVEK